MRHISLFTFTDRHFRSKDGFSRSFILGNYSSFRLEFRIFFAFDYSHYSFLRGK